MPKIEKFLEKTLSLHIACLSFSNPKGTRVKRSSILPGLCQTEQEVKYSELRGAKAYEAEPVPGKNTWSNPHFIHLSVNIARC